MATMQEHDQSMTVIYFKRTGEIHSMGTGVQSLSVFGEHEQDYSEIMECLVLPKDDLVLNNIQLFKIDIENKKIIYKKDILDKYN